MSDASASLGQRLKAERERKGLSSAKAADELHLDNWVVDALESGDYSRVGPSVYAKGHLKRYAELLGLPPGEILDSYETPVSADAPAGKASTLRMRTQTADGGETPWWQIVGFAAAAVVLAGVLWLKPWHWLSARGAPAVVVAPVEEPATAVATAEPGALPGGDPAAAGDDGVAGGGAGGGALTGPSAAGAVAADAPSAEAAPVPGTGRARLRLMFVADSWVVVHDATGQRVFAGTGHADNVRTIAGPAPLRVYIKTASSVHMDINNHAVAIDPGFIVDDAALFEAGADGVLRHAPHAAPSAAPAPAGAAHPHE